MSARVRTGGTCISAARFTRYVAQWDQYRRTRSRTGPPNSSYTGTPSARALTSSSAFSMAPMACWITPPLAWRRSAYISATCASHARGSLPMRADPSSSITRDRPGPPKFSLYSLQPVIPSSVEILRKSKLRQPASACKDSIRVIFIGGRLRQDRSLPQAPCAMMGRLTETSSGEPQRKETDMLSAVDFIRAQLKRMHAGFDKSLSDLTPEQLHAVPGGHATANTIGWGIWHYVR